MNSYRPVTSLPAEKLETVSAQAHETVIMYEFCSRNPPFNQVMLSLNVKIMEHYQIGSKLRNGS